MIMTRKHIERNSSKATYVISLTACKTIALFLPLLSQQHLLATYWISNRLQVKSMSRGDMLRMSDEKIL